MDKIYHTSGMHQAAGQAGIDVNWDTTARLVSYPHGILTKHFDVITPVLEANGFNHTNGCEKMEHLY